MLAKGPIGLMVPVLALGCFLAGKRRFGTFVAWYWLPGAVIVLAMLAPMLWGLYAQYGWHGIKFYFWTQSFGRITGQSSWHDSSGYFFFVHTFLWAFLPWALLAYYAMGDYAVKLIQARFEPAHANDMLLLGGAVFPFIALSFSHYKLPHYIFVIFPLVAILTARTVFRLADEPQNDRAFRIFFHIQRVLCVLTWVFALVCLALFFPCANPLVWLVTAPAAFASFYFLSPKQPRFVRLVLPSLFAIFGINIMINAYFFPQLMSFQGGSNAASSIRIHGVDAGRLVGYRAHNYSIEFYTRREIPVLDSGGVRAYLQKNDSWIYTDRDGLSSIVRMGFSPAIVDSFPNFHVAKVTTKFLFFKTRPSCVGRQYILHLSPTTSCRFPPIIPETHGAIRGRKDLKYS